MRLTTSPHWAAVVAYSAACEVWGKCASRGPETTHCTSPNSETLTTDHPALESSRNTFQKHEPST
eukprot:2247093-Pyramimonas_sp.AAC.1